MRALILVMALAGCAGHYRPDPNVPNVYERCKAICEENGQGQPKVAVETKDTFRCFCTGARQDGT